MIPLGDWLARGGLAQIVLPDGIAAAPMLETEIPSAEPGKMNGEAEQVALAFARREAELHCLFEARLAEERLRLETECEARLRSVYRQQAEQIAAQIEAGFDELGQQLSDALAQALVPVLTASTVARARAEFITAVAARLGDGNAARIELTVPAGLADELRARLSQASGDVVVTESEGIEARALLNGKLIATRIGEWLKAVGIDTP